MPRPNPINLPGQLASKCWLNIFVVLMNINEIGKPNNIITYGFSFGNFQTSCPCSWTKDIIWAIVANSNA